MTEQPTPQPSETEQQPIPSPPPQPTPTQPAPSQASSQPPDDQFAQILSTSQQVAQKTWVRLRPTVIQTLRGLTGQLQRVTQTLETQEAKEPSPSQPIDFTPVVQTTQSIWTKLQPIWQMLIHKIRPKLPEALQELSDRALSGVLAGAFLLLFWLTSSLPVGRAAAPPSRPPMADTSRPIVRPFPADLPTSKPAPIPQDLSAPDRQLPVTQPSTEIPSSLGEPEQPPEQDRAPAAPIAPPSPEQQLLSFLQEPLQAPDAIASPSVLAGVKPNPQTQRLTVTISPTWYSLETSTQDQLADLLLEQAQQKDFSQLELMDSRGTLVARSPIVGTEMVILKRR